MGTNFYLKSVAVECNHCGYKPDDPLLHIGKASGGWEFVFAAHSRALIPGQNQVVFDILTKNSWEIVTTKYCLTGNKTIIVNEYGTEFTFREFWSMVHNTRWGSPKLVRNHADNYKDGHTYNDSAGWSFINGEFC
jgi:hypothetical protein